MKDAFDAVIGYSGIKKELTRLADILKNTEKYKRLGVHSPKGVLLYGKPGTGKTTMADCFIKLSGRKSYVCRKTKADGDFIEKMVDVFEEAKNNAPSIVLLDDIDKYTERDDEHAEEFAAVQACMDNIGEEEVFVIATANTLNVLPDSLLRDGRLGKQLKFEFPTGHEAEEIIHYYLRDKRVSEDVDPGRMSRMLNGRSCAALENIINEAGIIAAFANRQEIAEEDIIESALNEIFSSAEGNLPETPDACRRVACHEAGHLVIGELLRPGSTTIASIRSDSESRGTLGFVHNYQGEGVEFFFEEYEKKLLRVLGGKAATEIVYGTSDPGANSDLHVAFDVAERMVDNYCSYGFDKWIQDSCEGSMVKERRNMQMSALLDISYAKARKMLAEHRAFLDATTDALCTKVTITECDIREIREAYVFN